MDMEVMRSGLCGRLWTPVDNAWRSTVQKVGVELCEFAESPPGVPRKPLHMALEVSTSNDRVVLGDLHNVLTIGPGRGPAISRDLEP